MNRAQAMDMAHVIVEELSKVPMTSNGYTVDGWKVPTLEEKIDAMVKLAEFLWEPEMEVTSDAERAVESTGD